MSTTYEAVLDDDCPTEVSTPTHENDSISFISTNISHIDTVEGGSEAFSETKNPVFVIDNSAEDLFKDANDSFDSFSDV